MSGGRAKGRHIWGSIAKVPRVGASHIRCHRGGELHGSDAAGTSTPVHVSFEVCQLRAPTRWDSEIYIETPADQWLTSVRVRKADIDLRGERWGRRVDYGHPDEAICTGRYQYGC